MAEDDEYEEDIYDLEASHSTKVAQVKYGNTGKRVDPTIRSSVKFQSSNPAALSLNPFPTANNVVLPINTSRGFSPLLAQLVATLQFLPLTDNYFQ